MVPPVRAGTNPTRWEYFCARAEIPETPWLNEIGAQGWEMVNSFPAHDDREFDNDYRADNLGFCFERALP